MYQRILVASDGSALSKKAVAGAIKRLLLGSETQQVLTHTELPVLVLR